MALLEVENLQTHFRTPDGVNRAVDGNTCRRRRVRLWKVRDRDVDPETHRGTARENRRLD